MPSRERIFSNWGPRGTMKDQAGNIILGGDTCLYDYSSCQDVTGPGDLGYLWIKKHGFVGGRINKPYMSGESCQDYIAQALISPATFDHEWVPGLLSDAVCAARVAARTNPSRPYVDIPINIIELGDITKLIRDSGRTLIQRAASNNLRYQFGIAPLVGDLVKLTRFRQAFAIRKREIERLQGPKGLRRTIAIDSGSSAGAKNINFNSNNVSVLGHRTCWQTSVRVTAHIRWRAGGSLRGIGIHSPAMESLIQRALLGLTIDASTAWEVIPWSWLIDWGSTVGNYFQANRNIIPASVSSIHIMRHSRTEHSWPLRNISTGGIMSGGTYIYEEKRRGANVPVLPVAHFPFLSGNQVGILSSLAVTRGR